MNFEDERNENLTLLNAKNSLSMKRHERFVDLNELPLYGLPTQLLMARLLFERLSTSKNLAVKNFVVWRKDGMYLKWIEIEQLIDEGGRVAQSATGLSHAVDIC